VHRAVADHCRRLIDAAGPHCVAVKPQLACFERIRGLDTVLPDVVAAARRRGLLVLLDAKRGDVPVTATAYAAALAGVTRTPFGEVPGLGADAFTANPLLGQDALAPLLDSGAGVFLLVRTSNPGAADVQDLELASGGALWEALARLAARSGAERVGACGLSDVGAVVGATAPEHLVRARALMPRTIFLLPGVGAQGGRVEDLAPAWAPGRAAGLVTASRSIARAGPGGAGGVAEELKRAAWEAAEGAGGVTTIAPAWPSGT